MTREEQELLHIIESNNSTAQQLADKRRALQEQQAAYRKRKEQEFMTPLANQVETPKDESILSALLSGLRGLLP